MVKIVKTTICGTDLGIWKGKNPEVADGRILGHEGIGIVEEVGEAVKNIKSAIKSLFHASANAVLATTAKSNSIHTAVTAAGFLGYMIDGTQAEYVRTPYADNSLVPLPDNVNEEVALLLSDALPTAHEIGVQYGDVKPGDTVFIAGAGPVGMSALLTAQLYSPAAIIVCDMDENRLKLAKELGATHTISPASGDVSKQVFTIVGEDGVDCAIEAVGIPATWNMCQDIVKPGGHIAVVGVHGQSVDFKLEKLGLKTSPSTTGLVNANNHRNADEGNFQQLRRLHPKC